MRPSPRSARSRLVSSLSGLAAICIAFVTMRAFFACVDTTPIVVVHDAFDPDASCLSCLQAPEGCADLLASCVDNPRCKPVYECMVRQSCLDLRTLDDKIKCGLPCAQEAGIDSVLDPVVSDYLVSLVGCGEAKCAEACNLQDASLGL